MNKEIRELNYKITLKYNDVIHVINEFIILLKRANDLNNEANLKNNERYMKMLDIYSELTYKSLLT